MLKNKNKIKIALGPKNKLNLIYYYFNNIKNSLENKIIFLLIFLYFINKYN